MFGKTKEEDFRIFGDLTDLADRLAKDFVVKVRDALTPCPLPIVRTNHYFSFRICGCWFDGGVLKIMPFQFSSFSP